jgi:hypothetical protein
MMGIKLDSNDFLNLTIHCLKQQEKMGQAGSTVYPTLQFCVQRASGSIPRSVRFCEFGLAAALQNRSSSSAFPIREWSSSVGRFASILLCLAESKFTKPSCARYRIRSEIKASSKGPALHRQVTLIGKEFAEIKIIAEVGELVLVEINVVLPSSLKT